MIGSRRTAMTACVTLAIAGAGALGTTLVKRSFNDLCARADVVFRGTVATVESRLDATSGVIHTYTTFENIEWIHGEGTPEQYTLRTLGGTAGGERSIVDGMPQFEVGDRYLLFVCGNGRVVCPVVGWRQGCFRIHDDASGTRVETYGGRRVMSAGINGLVTEPPSTGTSARVRPVRLDGFVAAIRSGIERARLKRESP